MKFIPHPKDFIFNTFKKGKHFQEIKAKKTITCIIQIMTEWNILLNDSVRKNTLLTVKQDTAIVNNPKSDNLERHPKEDNFNGKGINKKNILTYTSAGVVLATLIGIALDFKFANGKHVKKLFGKVTDNHSELKPITSEPPIKKTDTTLPKTDTVTEPDVISKEELEINKQVQEFFAEEEKELAKQKEDIKLSNYHNERWLLEQHRIKEKEYSDFWNSELEKIEQSLIELRQKEANKLEETIEKERIKFFEAHRSEIPSKEERYKAFLPLMRTEYGNTFDGNICEARRFAQEPENWLWYLWNNNPRAKEMNLELIQLQMAPKDLELYKSAKWVLDNKKLHYDALDLAESICSDQKKIIEELALNGKCFSWGEVIGHHKAYTINSALRLGYKVDDTLKVILDEGFRTVEPLEYDVTVYRHVCGGKADNSIDFINKLIKSKKGDTFIDKGYSYASFSEGGASSCNGIHDIGTEEVQLTILVPKGARVSNGSHYEQNELLFPRNAEYRVVEEATRPEPYVFRNNDGKEVKIPRALRMVVEYILPKT